MTDPSGALLDTEDLARLLKLSPRTIQQWRISGEGPPFIRLARNSPRYRMDDVQRWLDERVCRNTIESQELEEGDAR